MLKIEKQIYMSDTMSDALHIFFQSSKLIFNIDIINSIMLIKELKKKKKEPFSQDGDVGKCDTWILPQPHENYNKLQYNHHSEPPKI